MIKKNIEIDERVVKIRDEVISILKNINARLIQSDDLTHFLILMIIGTHCAAKGLSSTYEDARLRLFDDFVDSVRMKIKDFDAEYERENNDKT